MSRRPVSTNASPLSGALAQSADAAAGPLPNDVPARAAAAFADGHVDPASAPITAHVGAGLLDDVREAERALLVAEPPGTPGMVADLEIGPSLGSLPPAPEPGSVAGSILIVCSQPGFYRAGLAHPSRAEYPLDYFTADQLDQLWAEPKLQCIKIGEGAIVPRLGMPHGSQARARLPIDPLLAGQAAAAAIGDAPSRSAPGLRGQVLRHGTTAPHWR